LSFGILSFSKKVETHKLFLKLVLRYAIKEAQLRIQASESIAYNSCYGSWKSSVVMDLKCRHPWAQWFMPVIPALRRQR
jgi:hypothetical protein